MVAAGFLILSAIWTLHQNFSREQFGALFAGSMAALFCWSCFTSGNGRRWQEAIKVMRAMNEEIRSLKANPTHVPGGPSQPGGAVQEAGRRTPEGGAVWES